MACIAGNLVAAFAVVLLNPCINLANPSVLSTQQVVASTPEMKQYQAGLDLYKEGKYPEALAVFREIQAFYVQNNNLKGQREILINIGRVHEKLGRASKALQAFNAALDITQKLEAPVQAGSILIKMAGVYELLGEYDRSFATYDRALQIYRKHNSRRGEAAALTGKGLISLRQGKYTKALDLYQQALQVRRLEGDRYGEAITLSGIGVSYLQLGQPQKALDVHQQALRLRKQSKDIRGQAISRRYIGQTYAAFSRNRKALKQYQKALDIFRNANDFNGQERTLIRMAGLYNKTGQHQEALDLLYEARSIAKKISDRKGEGLAHSEIGKTQDRLQQYSEALKSHRYALALRQQIGDRAGEVETLSDIASLLEQQQQPETAVVFYKEAVNQIEDIRKELTTLSISEQEAYADTVAHVYRSLADLLLSQDRILEAQQVLELLKVQELRNFTRESRTNIESQGIATYESEAMVVETHDSLIRFGTDVKQCEEAQCPLLSQKLDQLEQINADFEKTVQELEAEIRSRRAQDFKFFDPNKLVRKAESIFAAQPNTVIVYPLVLEDKLWILWASAGGITRSIEVPGVGRSELGQAVLEFRQLLQDPNSDIVRLQATSKTLYDWLLPVELAKELKANQIENLIFSLDNVTRYIPTDALFSGERYLIEDYNLSTIISAELTDTTSQLPATVDQTRILALGLSNPVSGFNSLPNVPDELDAIVRDASKPNDAIGIYPGREMLNEQFTRKSMRDNLGGHQVLHIATHGEFIPGNRAQSSYVLLGDGDKLPISEVEKLRGLGQIHLVVLSACQTALGDSGQDGTEINGLSYYFLNGGAKAVIASLWNVNDRSTRLLMERFYSQLAQSTPQERITKAQAMRLTKLDLIYDRTGQSQPRNDRGRIDIQGKPDSGQSNDFSHPYYWAPFTIIGNAL
ncbi:Photosystem I assembly protein Ycf3 [Acaryochloris thomasi RCC1774]|uniref:Photosystem I assembly protein Ycf3 n=1 Tax=Acaryochloris thomasi RCC1774 TaxID=1764569 RepID=A0A2W1JGD4_9CYAN|nr:CHAT domain-containing protein [Acaryochloris thomasi]PZD70695.1 Photosystem I assembly protein Ycf3 [Acaryochloris thomasi RCC1774]